MKTPPHSYGKTERVFRLNVLSEVQDRLHNFLHDSFLHDLHEVLQNIPMKQLLP